MILYIRLVVLVVTDGYPRYGSGDDPDNSAGILRFSLPFFFLGFLAVLK